MQAALVHQFWQERLREGSVFYRIDQARPDQDFKRGPSGNEGNWLWPEYVCREALYMDFTSWTELPRCTKVEFFKLLTPFLYPWGKEGMVARFEVVDKFISGSGLALQKRRQRYFVRMLPLEVARAVARKRWNVGDNEAKHNDFLLIQKYRAGVASETHTGAVGAPVV